MANNNTWFSCIVSKEKISTTRSICNPFESVQKNPSPCKRLPNSSYRVAGQSLPLSQTDVALHWTVMPRLVGACWLPVAQWHVLACWLTCYVMPRGAFSFDLIEIVAFSWLPLFFFNKHKSSSWRKSTQLKRFLVKQ